MAERHPNPYQIRAFADRWDRLHRRWSTPDQEISLANHIAGDVIHRVVEPTGPQIYEAMRLLELAGVECPHRRMTWDQSRGHWHSWLLVDEAIGETSG